MIYLPDDEPVPPMALRCPDPQEASGICRMADRCRASRQRLQQRVARATGRECPWWSGMASAKACEPEGS